MTENIDLTKELMSIISCEEETLKEKLLSGEKKIAIIGGGFIGTTTAVAFMREGVECVVYDINPTVVDQLNSGKTVVQNLEFWTGCRLQDFIERGLLWATTNWEEMDDDTIGVYFIGVPTEKKEEPWLVPLEQVFEKLNTLRHKPLVIIESTLVPGTTDRFINDGKIDIEKLDVGLGSRRDWFSSPEHSLKNLTRIFAGVDEVIQEKVRNVLSIVCDNLLPASNLKVSEIIKGLENSLLHIPSIYAMQLSHAYPDVDINEILKLASTHWRIPLYYPSHKVGGYCIGLSSKYIRDGATYPEELTILHETIKQDTNEPYRFLERVIENTPKDGTIGFLGLSYKAELKVHIGSLCIPVIKGLQNVEIDVLIHDPLYTEEEIQRIFDGQFVELENENYSNLNLFDVIVLGCNHKFYSEIPKHILDMYLKNDIVIFDHFKCWKKHEDLFKEKNIKYFFPGCKHLWETK